MGPSLGNGGAPLLTIPCLQSQNFTSQLMSICSPPSSLDDGGPELMADNVSH